MNATTVNLHPNSRAGRQTEAGADAEIADAASINDSFADYQGCAGDTVFKAIFCGVLMNERRERMSSCQRGKSLAWHDGTKDDSQKFLVWLAKNCPKIPERTAYRFMEIAEKVLLHLGIAAMEGMRVSEMLTDLGSPASASILGYISGKTMRACLAGVVIEGDETTRLVRAQNGKHKGGTNAHDNRRDYPKFIIRHFKSISTIQAKWARIIAKHPGEHAKMMQALRAIILGGPVRLVDGGRLIDQDPWDKDFTRAIRDLANERLRED